MPAFVLLGNSDEVTTCDCCGRSELKGTVGLEDPHGNTVYFGSVCAARALGRGTTAKHGREVLAEAVAKRRAAEQAAQALARNEAKALNDELAHLVGSRQRGDTLGAMSTAGGSIVWVHTLGRGSYSERFDVPSAALPALMRARITAGQVPFQGIEAHTPPDREPRMYHKRNASQPRTARATAPAVMGECHKCLGKGRIRGFEHYAGGVCFECGGSGKIEIDTRRAFPVPVESVEGRQQKLVADLERWHGAAASERPGTNRDAWASLMPGYPDPANVVGWILGEIHDPDVRRRYAERFKGLDLPPEWYDRANAAYRQKRGAKPNGAAGAAELFTAESRLGEAPFDATRVARFLRAPDGALRVALVNTSTGTEFGSLPLADRSREELARVMAIVKGMQTRMLGAAPPAPAPPRPSWGPGQPDPVRPRPVAPAPPPPPAVFDPTFADKVETLARHIERAVWAKSTDSFAKAGKPVPTDALAYSALTIEPGRDYWYLRTKYGGRRWAVDTADSRVYPMNSAGVMGKKHDMPGVPILDMGQYDWASRYYWPPKLPSPTSVQWVRSDLPSPPPKKKPKAPEDVPVRFATAPNLDRANWQPTRKITADATELAGVTGSMQPGWQGGGYKATQGLHGAKLAAVIRADIKQAIEDGALPPMDVSVTTHSYSGGYSIDVEVMRLRAGVPLINPEWSAARFRAGSDGGVPRNLDRYTPEAKAILANLRAIHRRYNFDNSDLVSDYHHTRYYGDVDFSSTLVDQEEFDALARENLAPRRDAYLETSIHKAIQEIPSLRPLKRYAVRAFSTGGEASRLQLLDTQTKPPRELSLVDAGEGEILEMLYGWASEFDRKTNGRLRAGRRGRIS